MAPPAGGKVMSPSSPQPFQQGSPQGYQQACGRRLLITLWRTPIEKAMENSTKSQDGEKEIDIYVFKGERLGELGELERIKRKDSECWRIWSKRKSVLSRRRA